MMTAVVMSVITPSVVVTSVMAPSPSLSFSPFFSNCVLNWKISVDIFLEHLEVSHRVHKTAGVPRHLSKRESSLTTSSLPTKT
jgi:hypothetical protein